MTDYSTADTARLMNVTQAIVEEAARQGVAEVLADYGYSMLWRWPGPHSRRRRAVISFPRRPSGSR
jgi:hypothetical protein